MNTLHAPRALDHLVMPTMFLSVARARLTAIGFTVAPEARHPFGTANACVFLSDGTYIEPLAIADQEVTAEAMQTGNVFVTRDNAFRRRNGGEGLSSLALATADANADDKCFRDKGISAGDSLVFSRPFEDAAGNIGTASFSLAFAADVNAPDLLFFTCQRINAPVLDRDALQNHPNGVARVAGVVLSAEQPFDHAGMIEWVTGAPATTEPDNATVRFAMANTLLEIADEAGSAARFGCTAGGRSGLHAIAVRFEVSDLARAGRLLDATGVSYDSRSEGIVVPPAPGQGAIFVFEEIR